MPHRLAVLTAAAISVSFAPAVMAKGCIRGAAVGGVAGHYVGRGHAVAGAAVGCVVGPHRATVQARQQRAAAAAQARAQPQPQ